MKFNKLTSALMVFAAVGIAALPVSSALAAPDAAKIAERKARKSQAVGEKVKSETGNVKVDPSSVSPFTFHPANPGA